MLGNKHFSTLGKNPSEEVDENNYNYIIIMNNLQEMMFFSTN